MTRAELDRALTLEAGPELDEVVARVVFGRERCPGPVEEPSLDYYRCGACGGEGWFASEAGDALLAAHAPPPPYSTQIAAAWEVVEALTARGYGFDIGTDEACEYEVDFFLWDDVDDWCFTGISRSAPHAICRAALKALAEEVGGE